MRTYRWSDEERVHLLVLVDSKKPWRHIAKEMNLKFPQAYRSSCSCQATANVMKKYHLHWPHIHEKVQIEKSRLAMERDKILSVKLPRDR